MSSGNKAVVRRIYEEGFNKGNARIFDELYAPDFVHHSKTIHDIAPGPAGEAESMHRFREAIPDVQFAIEDQIAEGDRVACRLIVRGTAVRDFPPIQAGEAVDFRAVAIFRLAEGRVVEEWFYRDAGQ